MRRIKLNVGLGMTEATCVVTSLQYPEKDYTGSVGRPVANIDMK